MTTELNDMIAHVEQQIVALKGKTISQQDRLVALSSCFKDLTMARFIEELRTGKLEVRQFAGGWFLKQRT